MYLITVLLQNSVEVTGSDVCVCVWGGGGSGKVLELLVVQRRYMSARCPQGYRHRFKLVFLNILHLLQNNNSKQ